MSIVVVKLGGSSLQNIDTLTKLTELIHGLRYQGYRPVVVHGGGPAINQELTERGISWKFINGQRQTTLEMISVIEDVLANKINSMLVRTLQNSEIPAVGVSGASQNLLFCTQANAELEQVGHIEAVNAETIQALLDLSSPQVPVIAPIGVGAQNEKYNINADWAAAKIAVALKAEKLIFLTDQTGILNQNSELVSVVTPRIINKMVNTGVISGGMYTKAMTMIMALTHGVPNVQVLHASRADQLFGPAMTGTILIDKISSIKKKESSKWNPEPILKMIHN